MLAAVLGNGILVWVWWVAVVWWLWWVAVVLWVYMWCTVAEAIHGVLTPLPIVSEVDLAVAAHHHVKIQ